MKITCSICGRVHEGTIAKIGKPEKRGGKKRWISFCPICNTFIPVEVPEGKIVMAFVSDESPEYFTDEFIPEKPIVSYYAFKTPKAFLDKWYKVSQNPDSMWYFVMYEGQCICSGACDPCDIETFEEFFKIQKKINRHRPRRTRKLPPFVSTDGKGFYSENELLAYAAKAKASTN